ncbi:unnamed protein product [Rhizoctonia solani]|uniref:Uncharacterized protein n=1 Tax=Rhizoctonia solani TaxID=456999 RepID=A0A8H3AVH1_9AGAM|nr:unnamed protein product [Rhizoctonia solani]
MHLHLSAGSFHDSSLSRMRLSRLLSQILFVSELLEMGEATKAFTKIEWRYPSCLGLGTCCWNICAFSFTSRNIPGSCPNIMSRILEQCGTERLEPVSVRAHDCHLAHCVLSTFPSLRGRIQAFAVRPISPDELIKVGRTVGMGPSTGNGIAIALGTHSQTQVGMIPMDVSDSSQ